MAQKIVLWATKSPDAQLLPPFQGTFQLEKMRVTVDGSLKPQRVKFELENVPMSEGLVNFFKKFGEAGEHSDEIVVDADKLTFTDYLPFAFQIMVESSLKSTSMENVETRKEEEVEEEGEEMMTPRDNEF